ncbi:MAG: flavin reductase family protein [Parabacteroides sp.]|nr:flavin reductase family protein [Parabacteroides sp.]
MKGIEPSLIKDNFIEIIGKEWMLVSAGDKDKFNMMTASWGGVGFLWNKPVVFVFVRPERYTREFIDAKGAFTLSFLGEEHKAAHKICGSKSGREIDKVAATGLTPCFTDLGNPCFEESRLTLECKTLYVTKMDKNHFVDPALYEKWYSAMAGNPHNVYVAEIVNAWER